MTLPLITLPSGTPDFQADAHGIETGDVFGSIRRRQGTSRRRRLFTIAPHRSPVDLFLDEEQVSAFHSWFEVDLVAGERHFSARIKRQGAGVLWWDSEWESPPRYEPLGNGKWRVAGVLILHGEGSETPPAVGALSMELRVPVFVNASINAGAVLAMEISVPLT